MQFVFWQNMISIHQSALIKALAREHSVLLAVQTDFEGERESSGWTVTVISRAALTPVALSVMVTVSVTSTASSPGRGRITDTRAALLTSGGMMTRSLLLEMETG